MMNRRQFFKGATTAASGALLARLTPTARAADTLSAAISDSQTRVSSARPAGSYKPVITTNNFALPCKLVEGVKVFHLVAEPVLHEFAPGLVANCWGYNGHVHGPTIEAVEGDRVRIYVTNKLPEPTTVHWHGIFVPNGMDGVGGLTQKSIQPGETYKYEFTLIQHGTFMYHPHHDEMTELAMGMMGLFVIHPRQPTGPPVDHDFAIMLSEWRIDVGARRPDPDEMTDFNILTMNARCFPGTAPLIVKHNSRVRIRFGNLSAMDHHPIHLHGYRFHIVATDGGVIPESARWPETTVLVAVGQTRTVEFTADALGDWAMHCHMSHHVMNQMGHHFGNVIGMNTDGLNREIGKLVPGYMPMGQDGMGDMGEMGMPVPKNSLPRVGAEGQFDYITMGGMFTVLKVREEVLPNNADPGWFHNPPGTVATVAPEEDLKRDDVKT
jgi:FtsP/CotA-like multicopper oxidase with cupredoxin domain